MTDLTKDEIVKMAREAGYRADAKMHDHDYDLFLNFYTLCRAPLVAENEGLKESFESVLSQLKERDAELEQTRVQLAGCGVAAMQNTEESKTNRVERGAYGWSASYGDVCRMVDSEIELRAENAALKQAHEINADTLNAMQVEIDDWKARALKAEQVGKPFGWYSAKEDDFMLDKIRKTHERLNSHTHRIGKYDTALFTAPQPAAQESTSAVPVVRQMVEALEDAQRAFSPAIHVGVSSAIAAGQKFIKENGK
jgi:hypothetical protein